MKTIEQIANEAGLVLLEDSQNDCDVNTVLSCTIERFAALLLAEHAPGIIRTAIKMAEKDSAMGIAKTNDKGKAA